MQIKSEHLLRQQLVLKFLNYYKGKLDGIWGPTSIAAKKAFESTRDFAPAYPNNGLPFGDKDVLPKGMSYELPSRLITCVNLSETVIAELSGIKPVEPVKVAAVELPVIQAPVVPNVIESPPTVETEAASSQEVTNVQQNNNPNRNNPQRRDR